MPLFPLYLSGQDGEEGFLVCVGFCVTSSLCEGKGPCMKEACVSVKVVFSSVCGFRVPTS